MAETHATDSTQHEPGAWITKQHAACPAL